MTPATTANARLADLTGRRAAALPGWPEGPVGAAAAAVLVEVSREVVEVMMDEVLEVDVSVSVPASVEGLAVALVVSLLPKETVEPVVGVPKKMVEPVEGLSKSRGLVMGEA
ncbi:MAG: hypothetical protein Q9226_007675, partial [Calogaya cf. arnoldii]